MAGRATLRHGFNLLPAVVMIDGDQFIGRLAEGFEPFVLNGQRIFKVFVSFLQGFHVV